MRFTYSWWTQLLVDLNLVYIVLVEPGLADLNRVYIFLVDTAPWGPKWGLHRLGAHSTLGI
jgi:hypothetical protein